MADIKIFISSVQAEFSTERELLYDYIRQDALLGQFFRPFIFEKLPAVDITAPQAYLKEAAECDVYLGLYGVKYGNVDESGISPTEREYDEATRNHRCRLVFVKRSQNRDEKQKSFISKVEKDVIRKSFADYDELKTAVYASLIRYLETKEILRKLPFDASALDSATWNDIDTEKVRIFVEKSREKRHTKVSFSDGVEKILTSIHVLTDDGRLTNSAILLFGKDPQRFFRTAEVRCAQFYGTKVEKPIKNYQVYHGTLSEMIDQAVGFVMSRIDCKVGTRDRGTEVPVEYEIPESAVAEGIANAVAHRDYANNGSIQVMLFRDRFEIWNPGRLPYGLTTSKLRELHPSTPVNPVIAHPLFLSGYIEHLGTGTTDIIEACRKCGLKDPEFVQEEDFRVIIWRKGSGEFNEKVTEFNEKVTEFNAKSNRADVKLTKKQRAVLEYCMDIPRSSQEILAFIGVKYQSKTLNQYVNRLVELGRLRPTQLKENHPGRKYVTNQAAK